MPSRICQQSAITRRGPAVAVVALAVLCPAHASADTFCAPEPCSEGTPVGTVQQAIDRADSRSGPDTVAIAPGTHNLGRGVQVRGPDTEVRGAGIGTTIVTADAVPANNQGSGRIVIAGRMARLSDLTVRLPSAVTQSYSPVEGARVRDGVVERVRVDMIGSSYNAQGSPLGIAVSKSELRDVEVAFPPAIDATGVWIQSVNGESTQLTDVSISAQSALISRPTPDGSAVTITARRVRLRGYRPLFVGDGFLQLSDSLIDASPAPPGPSDAVLVHNQSPPVRKGVTLDRVTVVGNGDPQSVALNVAGLPGGGPSTFLRARHIAVAGFGRTLVHQRYGGDIAATIDYSNLDTSPGAIGDEGPGGGIVTDALAPGNRAGDPGFVAPAAGNYRLQDGSPAIDVGGDDVIPGASTDLGGDPRPTDGDGDGSVLGDAGAYEHPALAPAGGSGGGGFHGHRPPAFGVTGVERDIRAGTATLTVSVPGPARLVARAATIQTASGQARSAGTTSLQIRPTAATLRRLEQAGTAAVQVNVTYMPPGGQMLTLTKSFELRKEGATPRG
jgi:hypothetical protein